MKKLSIFFLFFFAIPIATNAQQISYSWPAQVANYVAEWEYIRPAFLETDFSEDEIVEISEAASKNTSSKKEDNFKVYGIRSNKIYENSKPMKADAFDYKVWEIVKKVIGDDPINKSIAKFATFKDPEESTLGFVVHNKKGATQWGLALNTTDLDLTNKQSVRDLVVVAVHEFAHLLTLNTSQAFYLEPGKSCSKVLKTKTLYSFGKKECAKEDSYLGVFAKVFWNTPEMVSLDNNWDISVNQSHYRLHPNDFVTEYAATSAVEDMAESFTDFVLRKKPTTALAKKDLKILFFYNYPELVTIRSNIRQKIAEYFI